MSVSVSLFCLSLAAEKVSSLGKDWHKLCLKCDRCNKLLNAGGHAEVSNARQRRHHTPPPPLKGIVHPQRRHPRSASLNLFLTLDKHLRSVKQPHIAFTRSRLPLKTHGVTVIMFLAQINTVFGLAGCASRSQSARISILWCCFVSL